MPVLNGPTLFRSPFVGIVLSGLGTSLVMRSLVALRDIPISAVLALVVGCLSEYLLNRFPILPVLIFAAVQTTLGE